MNGKKTFPKEKNSGTGKCVRKHLFFGSLDGLKKMGIDTSTHPRWKNPFMQVKFFDAQTGSVGEYYDAIRRENGGVMPYPLNPYEILTKGSKSPKDIQKDFEKELGSDYDFKKSKFEILHDVVVGRVTAGNTTLHNFGVKALKTYRPGKDQVLFEVLQKSEFSMTGTVIFTLRAQTEVFGAMRDQETGLQVQGLKDGP